MLYALGNSSSIFILFQRYVVVAAGFNIIYVKSESDRIKKRFIPPSHLIPLYIMNLKLLAILR